MENLECPACGNEFSGELQWIDDEEWYYRCPKCGTLFDEDGDFYDDDDDDDDDDYYDEDAEDEENDLNDAIEYGANH